MDGWKTVNCMGKQVIRMDGTELLVGNSSGLQMDEKQRFIDLEAACIHCC